MLRGRLVRFGIDEDENIERIAETTGLSTDSTEQLRDSFSEKFLSEGHSAFKLQYLAHLVRSMESYIRRELEDHRFFRQDDRNRHIDKLIGKQITQDG